MKNTIEMDVQFGGSMTKQKIDKVLNGVVSMLKGMGYEVVYVANSYF